MAISSENHLSEKATIRQLALISFVECNSEIRRRTIGVKQYPVICYCDTDLIL